MSTNNITDFWNNKEYYKTKEELINAVRNYYTTDFIDNFSKWKKSLKTTNDTMKEYLLSVDFNESDWYELSYDNFCSNVIKNIIDWINTNNDISINDMQIISEYIIDDHINDVLITYNKKKYSIDSLIKSIKNIKFL